MLRRVLFFVFCMSLSEVVNAAPLSRVLDVSVDIVVDRASAELEIISPKVDFLAVYDQKQQRFKMLGIPFQVRSVDGSSQNYTVSIAQLLGSCRKENDSSTALILTTFLDGQLLEFMNPSSIYTASPQREHSLIIDFPQIAPASISQACEGSVGISVAMVI